MCGIAGIHAPRYSGWDRLAVGEMLSILAHRGPDGSNIWENRLGTTLGIARLAMTDIATPSQVLQSIDGDAVLAYNGEIYNHLALRDTLTLRGWKGKTDNDGEVVLGLYHFCGLDFLSKIDGMFAIALWDQKHRRLILARDRIGIKPLFFYEFNAKWIFASELKAIVAVVPTSIDTTSIGMYCRYRFVPGPQTICQNVFKVEPGNMVVIESDNKPKHHTFWRPSFRKTTTPSPLLPLLDKAVCETAVAERPIGVWLSGGLDSASVCALLSRCQMNSRAFTIGYELGRWEDEGEHAQLVSTWLQMALSYARLTDDRVTEIFTAALWHLDEPLFTSVGLSTFELANLTSREAQGVLTGDGADELLMGYPYLLRTLKALDLGESPIATYEQQIGWLKPDWENILAFSFYSLDHCASPLYSNALSDPMDKIRWFELRYRLPDYHLTRVDRLSMAHGVEARLPFLRNEIVDWALEQSWQTLMGTGEQKKALKLAAKTLLPAQSLQRKKRPFTSPISAWLRGPLAKRVELLFHDSRLARDLGFLPKGLARLYHCWQAGQAGTDEAVWGTFALFEWYTCYLSHRRCATLDKWS